VSLLTHNFRQERTDLHQVFNLENSEAGREGVSDKRRRRDGEGGESLVLLSRASHGRLEHQHLDCHRDERDFEQLIPKPRGDQRRD
jgi:hypothetical protein